MDAPESIFDREDLDAKKRAIEEARAQFEAGQGIPWADVERWIKSWGTEHELPPPPWK